MDLIDLTAVSSPESLLDENEGDLTAVSSPESLLDENEGDLPPLSFSRINAPTRLVLLQRLSNFTSTFGRVVYTYTVIVVF